MSGRNEELPDGWKVSPLSAYCTIVMGQSPPSSSYSNSPRGLPFFQGKAEFGELQPTPRKWCTAPNKIAEMNDILLSIRAPVGPTNLASESCCIGRGLAALRPEREVEPRYILNAIRRFESGLASLATGSTFQAISGKTVSTFEIPLAPSAEQRRIVAKIEALQERSRRAREALAEVKPLLEQFRQSVLAAAFRGDLTADWRAQNPDVEPASELLKRIRTERRKKWEAAELAKYKAKNKQPPKGWQDKYQEPEPVDNSELPELPEGWCWSRFDEIALVDGGLTRHQSKRSISSETVPLVSVAAVQHGYIDSNQVGKIGLLPADGDKAKLEVGDLLIVEGNGSLEHIGRAALWDGSVQSARHQNHIIRVRPTIVNSHYGLRWLASPLGRENLISEATSATGLYNLSLSKVGRLFIPLAPLKEQIKITELLADVFNSFSEMDYIHGDFHSSLAHLDQSILAKAFRGKLVPQDPSDEPASVLLDRIRQQREAAGASIKQGRKPKGTPEPAVSYPQRQRRLDKGQVVLNLLLLLEAWEKPVSIIPLENALGLMERPDLPKSVDRAGTLAANAHKNASTVIYPQIDLIYANLVAKKVIRRVGKHAYELIDHSRIAGAAASQRQAARDAISSLMELMKRQQLDDAGIRRVIARQLGQPDELQTTGSGSR